MPAEDIEPFSKGSDFRVSDDDFFHACSFVGFFWLHISPFGTDEYFFVIFVLVLSDGDCVVPFVSLCFPVRSSFNYFLFYWADEFECGNTCNACVSFQVFVEFCGDSEFLSWRYFKISHVGREPAKEDDER